MLCLEDNRRKGGIYVRLSRRLQLGREADAIQARSDLVVERVEVDHDGGDRAMQRYPKAVRRRDPARFLITYQ